MLTVWLEFLICLALIAVAGSKLSKYGDAIAEKTGLSGTWIGIMMLATVTSLPELVTGLSSVILAEAPDIAVGSIFGSCVFNLSIIVILDFIHAPPGVYHRASNNLIVTAGFGLVLIGFTGLSLVLADRGLPVLWHVDLSTPLIILIYFLAMRNIFAWERRHHVTIPDAVKDYDHWTLKGALLRYTLASAVVVAVGIWLPFVGQRMGQVMGWQETFIGSLFIALATSLPEVVVTVAAARLGAVDMAVGNLFGSNLFNILIIAIDDIAYTPGSLLADASSLHLISAVSSLIMTGLAVVGIFQGDGKRSFKLAWTSVFLLFVYVMNSYLLFTLDG